jgi:hypothetical protein
MMDDALSVAWYRLRATWGRRWATYFSVVLLIGLVGGVAMAAVAGARRTQSAFPDYLATTKASDLHVQVQGVANLSLHLVAGAHLSAQLSGLPEVAHVASSPGFFVSPLGRDGRPSLVYTDEVSFQGSVNGEFFTQDRVALVKGRMADPNSTTQMVASSEAAHLLGWHIGETLTFGGVPLQQALSPGFNPETAKPAFRARVTLVGLVVFSGQVVNDDVDRFPTYILFTPALTERLAAEQVFPTYYLRLRHGAADVPTVESEIIRALPRGTSYNFHVTSVAEGQVERAGKPEVIALGVFGAIAALATLVIGGQAISRGLWEEGGDLDVLRALGAGPATLVSSATLGFLGAVVSGAILAAGVAVALSPLAPLGRVREVDPAPGLAFDWTVLGAGLLVLVAGLGLLTLALAYRRAVVRPSEEQSQQMERGSWLVGAAGRAALPVPAVAGLRFAFGRGDPRSTVPVRSVLIGAVVAVAVVVATLTFGSGLRTLVSHPRLYGWNFNYAISSVGGGNNIPPVAGRLLDDDPDVAGWSGYLYANLQMDGQTVPALVGPSRASVSPPLLSGHAVDGSNQVVLGAATLIALHKRVGDIVLTSYGSPKDAPVYVPPTPLVIVGTATMPAVGGSGVLHTSMGTGATISSDIEPPAFRRALANPDPNLDGPNIEFVRFRSGVASASGLSSLQRVADAATRTMSADPQGEGDTYDVLDVQRPAEIVNYQSTGATPEVLASGLAAGTIVALGLTLVASVRRRGRELALLKTLGFTRRQLAVAVAWQASSVALVGIVVGVPAGIVSGRWLWDVFARNIYAVPEPSVPFVQVAIVVVAALVLANLVAAVPGRMAARTKTALVLRAE